VSNVAFRLSPVPSPTTAAPGLSSRSALLGAATQITLHLSDIPFLKVMLCRLKIKRVSGTAANFTPLITSKTGAASGSIDQEFLGAATPVATLFDPSTLQSAPVPMVCDVNGNLYFTIQPDAGADNVFDYEIRFFVCV
jgi:hypothetical protein